MTKIIETSVLETERLILKPRTLEDSPALQKYFNNWNIIKHLNDKVPWPYPEDGAEDYLKNRVMPQIEKGETFVWTLNLKINPNDPIGLIEYRHITDREDNRGFWLAETYWKQGLMSEAVSAVNDFIFIDLGVDKIIVCNVKGNEGSRRVKEKTGAKFIGTKQMKHHRSEETEIWELTAENWKKFKKYNS